MNKNTQRFKIIQITDLHVGEENEDAHGVDVRQNFLEILSEAKEAKPDLLILTGDLCLRDPKLSVYQWQKSFLDMSDLDYEIIAGNHDDTVLLAKTFEKEHLLKGKELFFKKQLGNRTCLFLDSAVGELSDYQLNWLKEELNGLSESVVIFIHHPPLNGQVVFMENKYALREREKIQEILFGFPYPISVFCGHYHVEKIICQQNVTMHITPSTYVQIDDRNPDFQPDHHQIAFREIIFEGEQISSSVRYFEGIKKEE